MAGKCSIGVLFTRKTFILVRNNRFALSPQSASGGTLGDTLERHETQKEKPKKNHKLKSSAHGKLFLFLTKKLSLQPIISFQ